MTNKDLIVKLAALLTTLVDSAGPSPASYIYLAFGADMDAYNVVTGVASRAGWITLTSETVELTASGRAKAREIEAAMAGA